MMAKLLIAPMKISYLLHLLVLFICIFTTPSWAEERNSVKENSQQHNAWLKQRFSQQHEKLIPIIAVADMFYACNLERKVDPIDYQLTDIIVTMDKNKLAQKLALCLGDDTVQSTEAISFGLIGCFHSQLAHLPRVERQQKMRLVKRTILSLSSDERKRSFTQCVTEQAIQYLK